MPRPHETIIEWEAPEFRHYSKNPAWYITLLIVAVLLTAYLFIQKDYFGGISLVIITGFIIIFGSHKPQTAVFAISDQGIHLNDTKIPYERIKHFWVVDDHHHKVLNFETTAYLNHLHSIELEDQDPQLIRDVLNELLPEHDEPEPTSPQKIAHRLRF